MSPVDCEAVLKLKTVEFKKWTCLGPGEHPVHKHVDPRWIRKDKGHDVTRPYFKYSTSKWEAGLIDLYEILLDPFKHEPITLLEMGVYQGESMRYYRDFFTSPETKIIGVDYFSEGGDFSTNSLQLPNVFLEKADQRDTARMSEIAEKYGPFEVINDDASHDIDITENCFRLLWPYLKDGGFYLIEDIQPALLAHLLNEVVVSRQGKGILFDRVSGFGPTGTGSGAVALKKTKDTITGLDEDIGRVL